MNINQLNNVRFLFLFIFLILSSSNVFAFETSLELLLRAHYESSFNIPTNSLLSNASPALNDSGDVAVKVSSTRGEPKASIWLLKANEKNGHLIYTTDEDEFLTDPKINEARDLSFSVFDEFSTKKLLVFSDQKISVIKTNTSSQYYSDFYYFNDQDYFYKFISRQQQRLFQFVHQDQTQNMIKEGDEFEFENKKYRVTYLFRPSVNNNKNIVFKLRAQSMNDPSDQPEDELSESQPDFIALLNSKGLHILLADQDAKPTSPFKSFNNSMTLSDNGAFISFIARGLNNLLGVYLFNLQESTSPHFIAEEKSSTLNEIELFTPKVNNQGTLAFRAKDSKNIRGVYIYRFGELQKVISEGDAVMTDLGFLEIYNHPKLSETYPGFSGEITLNNLSELAFTSLLWSPKENKTVGHGVFKIKIK